MNDYNRKTEQTQVSDDEALQQAEDLSQSSDDSNGSARSEHDFILVGIGASAGGIKALKEFFAAMPATSGMAFVVILHLSQQYESNLAGVLQATTRMPVMQVTEPVKVEPNRVYVIPPAKHLAMVDGTIQVTEPERTRGKRVPIDLFFRTLAESYADKAISIVLSGTGADGTLGIKRIKECGGICIAQDPAEADYDGMPASAIATNLVDLVLPVREIPEKLLTFVARQGEIQLSPAKTAEQPDATIQDAEAAETVNADADPLREILAVVRARTGHDFSTYKQPTLLRRLARRLQINELTDVAEYLNFLRESSEEVQELLRDLLITVTNFFRDREAFEALEHDVVPRLFAGKTGADTVRVWVCATATGEEAYSVAILLHEYAARLSDPPKIQIFATDINEDAIAAARACLYEETIVADVTPARLRRFFTKEDNGYRVKKEIRELVLFAAHNVLRDPAFTKLDLITCRNLLIYLNRDTQERVLELFGFALRDPGHLFLGSSETGENLPQHFIAVNKKQRIYRNRFSGAAKQQLPPSGLGGSWAARVPAAPLVNQTRDPEFSYGELHYKMLERYAPPSILINDTYDIVHLSENAGRFLRIGGGEPSLNLVKTVHLDLVLELRNALIAARQEGRAARSQPVPLNLDGEPHRIALNVQPLETGEAATNFFLVIFEEVSPETAPPANVAPRHTPNNRGDAMEAVVRRLEDEVRRTKDRLRGTIEQHETSTEELKASNEELQAINEELRSATEELETSKEELQSVNEELVTVNAELKEKIDEASRTNSDLNNFLASTEIATIFLDRSLSIKRYTPWARKLFNLIAADIGRPLEHLTHRLEYDELSEDASEVLRTLQSVEREVRGVNGQQFIARFLPYRTADDRIDGVVLNFIDITARKRAEEALHRSETRLRLILESAKDYAIFTTDLERRVNDWSFGAAEMFGYSEAEIIGESADILFTPEDRVAGAPQHEAETALRDGRAQNERWHSRRDESRLYGSGVVMPLRDDAGNTIGFVKIMRDLTEEKRAGTALRQSEERLRLLFDSATDFAIMTMTPDGMIDSWSAGATRVFGYTEAEAVGQNADILFTPADRAANIPQQELEIALRDGRSVDERYHLRRDGRQFYASGVVTPLRDNGLHGFVKIARDLTEQKQMQETLREADRRKDEFLATLAHELRNPLAPVRTALEIMRRGADKKQGQYARQIIERQIEQITHLVDDLLDISRISGGKIKLQKSRFDITEAVTSAIEASRPMIDAAQHQLETKFFETPIFVEADPHRLTQVFSNILGNAARYTEPGGRIIVETFHENDTAVVRVKDTGIGIAPEMLTAIFDMFTQGERILTRGHGGLGIGLSLVKRLVEMHGGTATAESAGEGRGSEFVVRLPLAADQTAPDEQAAQSTEFVSTPQPAQIQAAAGTQGMPQSEPSPAAEQTAPAAVKTFCQRILVVDDNVDAAEMLETLLTLDGHTVRTAFDGGGAIKTAAEFQPQVAFLDIGLPDIDGYEVARRIRVELPDALLVALSGWGQDEDRRRSAEVGFDYHLVKPVKVEDVTALLTTDKASAAN